MPTSQEILATARAMLAKGNVAGARDALAEQASDEVAVPASDKPAPPPEPRSFDAVMLDFAKGVHSLLGHSPALVPLINELAAIVTAEAPSSMTPKN